MEEFCDKKYLLDCLLTRDRQITDLLFEKADRVRKEHVGDEVYLRGIIEFSNYCSRNCLYCGLRRGNSMVDRYRMDPEEIMSCARKASGLGIGTVVLQSGEDSHYSVKDLCGIVEKIKRLDLAVTLSVGERSYGDYRRLREAGTDRYLLRFETSDEKLYEKLRPGRRFADRVRCLEALSSLGFQTGSGVMIGLPGQTPEVIANDITLFRSLDLDMVGIGPFLPHPHTPLAGFKPTGLENVLKALALTRIATENAHIPATTAVGTLDSEGRQKALACGANVLMPNITPPEYRKLYEIYPDKICINENADKCGSCVKAMIAGAGRKLGTGFGHSFKQKFREDHNAVHKS